ncbi:hypothetical protein JD844_020195 [Phrynosoma platyrhinos]|uniref:unspecific monooxygenase n=1 Tax=Phrynosoma platyrhinos TaxID=52577 RepID=A0ABQ7SS54_PHRPL|nr:hypothetical protein JD844_020195 [Phrynosoma platyrhinos]
MDRHQPQSRGTLCPGSEVDPPREPALELNSGLKMEPLGTTSIFLIIFTSCLVLSAIWKSKTRGKGKLPPGPTPLPFIGNALQLRTSHLDQTLRKLANTFPTLMEYIPGPHHRIESGSLKSKQFFLEEAKEHRATLDPSSPRDFIDCFYIKMDQEVCQQKACNRQFLYFSEHNWRGSTDCVTCMHCQEKYNDASEFNMDNLVISSLDLFGAGTETTSTTLRYGLLILQKYPKIEGKMGTDAPGQLLKSLMWSCGN